MKKLMNAFLFVILDGLVFSSPAIGQHMSTEDIIKELRAAKKRVTRLEQELTKKDREIEELKAKAAKAKEPPPAGGEEGKKWTDRVEISGAIEVEYGVDKHDIRNGPTSRDEDIVFATVELGIDAQINKYVLGSMVLLYEEDDNEEFTVDEGSVAIGGIEETYGLYFKVGKYYPHFGELNTFLVSDPLTLEIFEIQESAAEVGYEGDWFSVGAGVFTGDIDEIGGRESDIKGFFADANFHYPDKKVL